MTQQLSYVLNLIQRFPKIDCKDYCRKLMVDDKREDFCLFFIMWYMDRDNLATWDKPLVQFIRELTDWSDDSIRNALKSLETKQYVTRVNYKTFRVEKAFANKLPSRYEGKQEFAEREYSAKERKLIETMNKTVKHTKDGNMIDIFEAFDELKEKYLDLQIENAELRGENKAHRAHASKAGETIAKVSDQTVVVYEKGLDKGLALPNIPVKNETFHNNQQKLKVVKKDDYEISH